MPTRIFSEFDPLSLAEQKLLANLDSPDFDRLDEGGAPVVSDAANAIRASLLRYLILRGPQAPRLHEKGLRLSSAWVTGPLDLEGCRIPCDIGLVNCRFEEVLILRSAVIDTLFLDGSILPGLVADRLEARGSIYLRAGTINGAIDMHGARLGGEFMIDGATVGGPEGTAFDGSNMEMRGDLTLRGAQFRGPIKITGARVGGDIRAIGASIEQSGPIALAANGVAVKGDVSLRDVRITGEATFIGARVEGDFYLDGGTFKASETRAVTLNRAAIDGALFMREQTQMRGAFSLNATRIGTIVDEPASWPEPGDLLLNRCRYDGFVGGPVDAQTRLDWLSRQSPERWGEDFWPQPYEQLSAVLRQMGHEEDARTVLFEKERLQRYARRVRAKNGPLRAILFLKDTILRLTVGYGLKTYVAFVWLAIFWLAGVALLTLIEGEEQLRPNVTTSLRTPEWVLCGVPKSDDLSLPSLDQRRSGLAAVGQSQLACFREQPEAGSFPKFNSWMYSLDSLIPGLETGQRNFWSPDTRFTLGRIGKIFEHVQMIIGTALSLLAFASFSGLVKSR